MIRVQARQYKATLAGGTHDIDCTHRRRAAIANTNKRENPLALTIAAQIGFGVLIIGVSLASSAPLQGHDCTELQL